jgi:hypothetical protein
MEELINMVITDESPAEISDKIKELLYRKAAENVDALKPYVASTVFGDDYSGDDEE